MPVFLVESDIPPITREFMEIIPVHREVVNRLFAEGKLLMYAVNEERTQWWCSIKAEDEFAVMDVLGQMPLMPFLKPRINNLMFYNGTEQMLPVISLN